MKIQLLLFGIATDLLETSSTEVEVSDNCSLEVLKEELQAQFPKLEHLNSYAIAVNESYATSETILKQDDVVAIIPPVSGG